MHSLGQRMREGWMSYINFCNSITFLAELYFEQQEGTATVPIPPFVLIHMLCVLCYFRLGDMSNCQQSLTYLQTLLLYGDGTCVALDIWETFLGSNLGSVSSLCRTTMGCYSLIENIQDQKKKIAVEYRKLLKLESDSSYAKQKTQIIRSTFSYIIYFIFRFKI